MAEAFRLPPAPAHTLKEFDPAGPVLVVLPARTLGRGEVDVLRVARELVVAAAGEREIIALWPHADLTAADAAEALQGVDRVLSPVPTGEGAEHLAALLDASVPQAVADATFAAAHEVHPAVVLLASGAAATETAGQVAVRLGSGAMVDAGVLEPSEGGLRVTRTVLDATWTTQAEMHRGVGVVTVQYGATVTGAEGTGDAAGGLPEIVELPVLASPATGAITLIEHTAPEGAQPLSGAERVVVVGRGVEGDLTLANKLAERFGAAMGATRDATDRGWLPRETQIGQSGVVISPRLYIGIGLSGQIHHTLGIMGSQHIVAVCDDPDAPIFEIADFGVVGDLNNVVPQLLEALDA